MTEDFIKIIGIVVIIGFLVYLATKSLKLHMNVMEGLTNPTDSSATSGIGASSGNYSSALQNKATKLNNDILLLNNTVCLLDSNRIDIFA
jgi:hypothetical protein